MKRIICFVLTLIIMTPTAGCGQSPNHVKTTLPVNQTEVPLKPIDTLDEYYEYIESAQEVSSHHDVSNAETGIQQLSQWNYSSFEETLTDVTDVVKATFVATKNLPNYFFYKFEVKEILNGSLTKEIIYVPQKYNGSTMEQLRDYQVGSDYLLLLRRYAEECVQEDILDFADTSIIPIDKGGNIDINNCTVYEDEKLIDFIATNELKIAAQSGRLIEGISALTSKNTCSVDYSEDIIFSCDPDVVLNESPYVACIYILKQMNDQNMPFYHGLYECEVELIKGERSEKTVMIYLPKYFVKLGERYVVALDDTISLRDDYLRFSGRYSMFEILEAERIKAILEG